MRHGLEVRTQALGRHVFLLCGLFVQSGGTYGGGQNAVSKV